MVDILPKSTAVSVNCHSFSSFVVVILFAIKPARKEDIALREDIDFKGQLETGD